MAWREHGVLRVFVNIRITVCAPRLRESECMTDAGSPAGTRGAGASSAEVSNEDSRAAMRAFLQRSEVRLSTIHRVAQALLGGSALVLLLPLFIRDGFPKLTALLISCYDARQSWVSTSGIAVAAVLSIVLPVAAIFLLVGDLLGFYFTSNTFGALGAEHGRTTPRFNPRFIIPGLGFNDDELSDEMRVALDAGRRDEWTKALLVPRTLDDAGWRDRFDTRMHDIWGFTAAEGFEGDDDRLRQSFRLAGLNRDRTLAGDVARTEALLARHVLTLRIVVLRYTKALLLIISTTVATLAAAAFIEDAARVDPTGGRFEAGFPYRYLFLVGAVYVFWAPLAARSVTAPLRVIQRHTPGVGKYQDVYLDKRMTQFESATVFATLLGLIGASAAMIEAGWDADGGRGLAAAVVVATVGVLLWAFALRDYAAGPRQTIDAVRLFVRAREAPVVSRAVRPERRERDTTPRAH